MTQVQTVTFTLSQEEVQFILSQVRAKGLLGLDPTPLAAFTAQQRQQVLAAAGRALQVRGLITRDPDGTAHLDPTIRATIHAAAFAQKSLTVLIREAGAVVPQTLIYHHTESLWVEHTQSAPELHTFSLSVERPDIQGALETALGLERQPAPDAEPFVLDQRELDEIQRAAASDGGAAVRAALGAAGLDEATTERFAELIEAPRTSAILQSIDRSGPVETTRTITILHNTHGFWLIESAGANQLQCVPADADTVRDTLASLIEQL